MKKAPNLWTLESLSESVRHASAQINGKWVPARPLGLFSLRYRMRLSWLVFSGKADALKWPEGQ